MIHGQYVIHLSVDVTDCSVCQPCNVLEIQYLAQKTTTSYIVIELLWKHHHHRICIAVELRFSTTRVPYGIEIYESHSNHFQHITFIKSMMLEVWRQNIVSSSESTFASSTQNVPSAYSVSWANIFEDIWDRNMRTLSARFVWSRILLDIHQLWLDDFCSCWYCPLNTKGRVRASAISSGWAGKCGSLCTSLGL